MMLTTSGAEVFWVSARQGEPQDPCRRTAAMAPILSSQTAVGWFSTTRILAARDGFDACCATASDSTSAFHSGFTY